MRFGIGGVEETMGGTTVNESVTRGVVGVRKGNIEGVGGRGKSGRVESEFRRCTAGINATPRLRGILGVA